MDVLLLRVTWQVESRSGFSVLCLLAGISVTEEQLRVIVSSTSSSIYDHVSALAVLTASL